MKLLAEYGKFDSEWFSRVVWSDESIFQLHADLQRGVFENLVRTTIVELRWRSGLRRWFASATHRGTGFRISPLPRAEFGWLVLE